MEDYNKKTVYSLKTQCLERKLSTAGHKADFVRRLVVDDLEKKKKEKAPFFNEENDPYGTNERKQIDSEFAIKRDAHYQACDASITHYKLMLKMEETARKEGYDKIIRERDQKRVDVEKRVHAWREKMKANDIPIGKHCFQDSYFFLSLRPSLEDSQC
jgi:hypothetical protein